MANFKDKAIDKAKSIADKAVAKKAAAASDKAAATVAQAQKKVAETASKQAAKIEAAVGKGLNAVAGAKDKIGQSVTAAAGAGKVKSAKVASSAMAAKFSPTAFLGKAVDAIGTVDVHGISDNAVKNLASDASKQLTSIFDNVKNTGASLLKDLTTLQVSPTGQIGLNVDSALSRVKGALGGSAAAVERMGDTLKQNAVSSLASATGGLAQSFIANVGGTSTAFTASDSNAARGLFDTVNQMTQNPSMALMLDVGAETTLKTGLFREAIALGVPKVIDVLVQNQGSTQSTKQALKNVVKDAMNSGSTVLTQTLLQNLGASQVLAIEPQAVGKLLSGYTLDVNTKQSDLPSKAGELKSTLNQLDPNWKQSKRKGEAVSDLGALSKMSKDAKRVLETDPELRDEILIAGAYGDMSFAESMQEKYPMVPQGRYA